tara:strand:+ start:542 stop:1408 length:867 start_codon:yes stop_codon:yes gene_type:complete
MSDLLDSSGDVKSGALDNVPASDNASALTSGTLPDGRFPATLPAASGANLTALNATNVASGTLAAARLPAEIVSSDSTPQLGGDLDVNGNSVVSASDGNIAITPNGTGSVVIDGLSHPQADGSAGQFMKTDGSGQLSFATVDLTAINILTDTSPQLGGNLDVNGNSIVSASNGNIAITPNGSGSVVIDGLSHPQADGSAGQFMKTDGSGQLSFATVDLTAINIVTDTTPQLGGTLDTNGQAIQFGSSKWTIELSGNNLLFKYNGTAKIKFADDGEIVTVDDVTAFGAI